MTTKRIDARVQNKRDTEANWLSENPVLLDGELIFVDLTSGGVGKKVGDGVSAYADLPMELVVTAEEKAAWNAKAEGNHLHTIESIDGLQEAINVAADSKFYVVTFDRGDDGEYHADLTFAQIREKYEAGGNMVARIDGTDYIPLLSAASHQIIFSGIYQSQSVGLTITSSDVCTLTTTHLVNRNDYYNHTGNKENPHGVTAAQVGAPTIAEMNAAIAAIPAPDMSSKQDKITGTPGDFVVIGSDGAVTTKTIANAEEASF